MLNFKTMYNESWMLFSKYYEPAKEKTIAWNDFCKDLKNTYNRNRCIFCKELMKYIFDELKRIEDGTGLDKSEALEIFKDVSMIHQKYLIQIENNAFDNLKLMQDVKEIQTKHKHEAFCIDLLCCEGRILDLMQDVLNG